MTNPSDDLPAVPKGRHPAEALASVVGKTPAEVAAIDRILTGLQDLTARRLTLALSARDATAALNEFAAAWMNSEDQIVAAEADVIAAHPDLQEWNVGADGFYA